MRIHYFTHVPFEGPAKIHDWAQDRRHSTGTTRLFANDPLPPLDEVDALIIMGGPMSANDDRRLDWMKKEKEFIAQAIEGGKKVFGICLGAQLIASALDANVYPNREKEIGWFPIELNPPNVRQHPLNVLPQRATVFHWHGETFDLPKGAQHLARSRACENQAFGIGRQVVGLQFHIEVGRPEIESWVQHGAAELTEGAFVQNSREMVDRAPAYAPPLHAALFRFLDAFTSPLRDQGDHYGL
ncbi:MAG: type 1 glutamine amidotransferase [Elusimicrobiota bacterium]|jgi:GMP synthase (glutamine-hydrolysing)